MTRFITINDDNDIVNIDWIAHVSIVANGNFRIVFKDGRYTETETDIRSYLCGENDVVQIVPVTGIEAVCFDSEQGVHRRPCPYVTISSNGDVRPFPLAVLVEIEDLDDEDLEYPDFCGFVACE